MEGTETAAPRRGRVATEVVAAFAITLSNAGATVAFAALIFVGPLASGLSRATSSFLLATALSSIALGVFSRFRPVVGLAQDGPAIVLVAVAARLSIGDNAHSVTDVMVLIGLVSLLSAVAMFVVSRLGLSSIVRYMPMTVISGFVAGTGWLLFKGGFDVMMNRGLGLGDLAGLIDSDKIMFWLPGLALGVAILFVSRLDRTPPWLSGVMVLMSIVVFYFVARQGMSQAELESGNWLVGPFGDGASLRPITPAELGGTGWSAILGEAGAILTIIGVVIVATLLNISGLETSRRTRVEYGRELEAAGLANVVGSLFGGLVSFHALGDSTLAQRMGARSRATPIGSGMIILLFAIVGATLVGLVPRMTVGALLVVVGLGLLSDWVDELRRTPQWIERVLGAAIVIVIATVGILEGIGFGVLIACLIFIFRYSRIDPVRRESTGAQTVSRVDRSAAHSEYLHAAGDRVAVYELQGFLFFGSVTAIADRLRARCEDTNRAIDSVHLDFRNVTGIDSSGMTLLGTLDDEVRYADATLTFSSISSDIEAALRRSQPDLLTESNHFPDLDTALEHAETQQLQRRDLEPSVPNHQVEMLNGWLSPVPETGHIECLSKELVRSFDPVSVAAGTVLVRQGEPSNEMHLVVSGELSASSIDDDGTRHRLRRFGAGSLLGEIGFLTMSPRTADVEAEGDVELLRLDRATYDQLRDDHPDLILEFHDYVLTEQAARSASMSENLSRALR